MRGGVLGGAFAVERNISAIIVYFMLGDRVNRDDVQIAFSEGLLDNLNFYQRIEILSQIAPHFINADEAKDLKGKLTELRKNRNAMAHNPFWFHPELNDKAEVVNLVPMIMRGKTSVVLTTQFTERLNEQIASLIDQSSKLAATVSKREVS